MKKDDMDFVKVRKINYKKEFEKFHLPTLQIGMVKEATLLEMKQCNDRATKILKKYANWEEM